MLKTIAVANFRTQLEAEIAARSLEAADIPFIIQSAEGMAHGPIFPGATILVREEDADAAREALTA